MTELQIRAKKKTEELVDKFRTIIRKADIYGNLQPLDEMFLSQDCAKIAVNEIIKSNPTNPLKGGYIELYSDMIDEAIEFWQEVLNQIEHL
jgi:hypothetical protein